MYLSKSSQFQPETSFMTIITNGITSDDIREMLPSYHLSTELLEATLGSDCDYQLYATV
jgi:hypothetical protein